MAGFARTSRTLSRLARCSPPKLASRVRLLASTLLENDKQGIIPSLPSSIRSELCAVAGSQKTGLDGSSLVLLRWAKEPPSSFFALAGCLEGAKSDAGALPELAKSETVPVDFSLCKQFVNTHRVRRVTRRGNAQWAAATIIARWRYYRRTLVRQMQRWNLRRAFRGWSGWVLTTPGYVPERLTPFLENEVVETVCPICPAQGGDEAIVEHLKSARHWESHHWFKQYAVTYQSSLVRLGYRTTVLAEGQQLLLEVSEIAANEAMIQDRESEAVADSLEASLRRVMEAQSLVTSIAREAEQTRAWESATTNLFKAAEAAVAITKEVRRELISHEATLLQLQEKLQSHLVADPGEDFGDPDEDEWSIVKKPPRVRRFAPRRPRGDQPPRQQRRR